MSCKQSEVLISETCPIPIIKKKQLRNVYGHNVKKHLEQKLPMLGNTIIGS